MSNNNKETLLRVENLCMYFKMGKRELKAVDNVSFDIKKGEVFGLVGESGCGKTTTGRSIIKIYDVTGGDVYFKGQRICAGTRSYTDAIKVARKDAKDRITALKDDTKLNPANAEENKNKINEIKAGLNAELDGQAGIQELAGDATMLYYMTEEAQEGGKAFLEKRKPRFRDYPKFP